MDLVSDVVNHADTSNRDRQEHVLWCFEQVCTICLDPLDEDVSNLIKVSKRNCITITLNFVLIFNRFVCICCRFYRKGLKP